MHAAVVRAFDHPPRYEEIDLPAAAGEDALTLDVLAAALHHRVRSMADGTHYESTGELPLIPGIDGVGRDADGRLRYFVLPDTRFGSMAERAVIDRRRSAVLPDGVDPVTIAAAMNPAMSSWIALRKRIDLAPGARVLVLGATGNAGQMAVQIAKHLGAAHVVAAGRDAGRLAALAGVGADALVSLEGSPEAVDAALGGATTEVDVVLDYLWGSVSQRVLPAVLTARRDRGRPLTWIQIGSVAGPEITLPSAWLRAARVQLVGSGQGSVPAREIVAELPGLATHITDSDYAIDAVAQPLSDVERIWRAPAGARRTVLVP
ncbi:MAG: NADPH:quinone reductase [Conexibacter sp.]|nr:NADPH:quinone reductase [Conexibacter sp.]